jgi:hypothetical protein
MLVCPDKPGSISPKKEKGKDLEPCPSRFPTGKAKLDLRPEFLPAGFTSES